MRNRKTVLSATHIGSQVSWEDAVPFMKQRLEMRIKHTDSGCWEYTGNCNEWGYGQLDVRKQRWMAHRLAYTLWIGPIPEGMDILHSCDNPPCINPAHLRPGTQLENSLEMVAKGRTDAQKREACPRGHKYDEHNTGRYGKSKWRDCKICSRARNRIRAGWPEELAYSMGPVPHGYRPVNAIGFRKKTSAQRKEKIMDAFDRTIAMLKTI